MEDNTSDSAPVEPRIVEGKIGPILAKDLRNIGGKASATGKAETLYAPQFTTPPSEDSNLDAMRVTDSTHERAAFVARDLIAAQGDGTEVFAKLVQLAASYIAGALMPAPEETARGVIDLQAKLSLTPISADLLTLSYAYIARVNASRE